MKFIVFTLFAIMIDPVQVWAQSGCETTYCLMEREVEKCLQGETDMEKIVPAAVPCLEDMTARYCKTLTSDVENGACYDSSGKIFVDKIHGTKLPGNWTLTHSENPGNPSVITIKGFSPGTMEFSAKAEWSHLHIGCESGRKFVGIEAFLAPEKNIPVYFMTTPGDPYILDWSNKPGKGQIMYLEDPGKIINSLEAQNIAIFGFENNYDRWRWKYNSDQISIFFNVEELKEAKSHLKSCSL